MFIIQILYVYDSNSNQNIILDNKNNNSVK